MTTTIELDDDQIAIIWSVDDVMQQCEWLTREQAQEVLWRLDNKHDACIGVNWDVIEYTAQSMYQEGL